MAEQEQYNAIKVRCVKFPINAGDFIGFGPEGKDVTELYRLRYDVYPGDMLLCGVRLEAEGDVLKVSRDGRIVWELYQAGEENIEMKREVML